MPSSKWARALPPVASLQAPPPPELLQKYTETKRKAGSDFMHRGMDNRLLESSFRNNPASLCPRPIYKYRNKEKKLQQYV